jgi:hypothetical protein
MNTPDDPITAPKVTAGEVNTDKLSAFAMGKAAHESIDQQMLMLQRQLRMAERGKKIGMFMMGMGFGALIMWLVRLLE